MAIQITKGAHHIGLTVPNLANSEEFFVDTLGFNKVGDCCVFCSDGTVPCPPIQLADQFGSAETH